MIQYQRSIARPSQPIFFWLLVDQVLLAPITSVADAAPQWLIKHNLRQKALVFIGSLRTLSVFLALDCPA